MGEIVCEFRGKGCHSKTPKTERWSKLKVGSKIHIMTKKEIEEYYGSIENISGFRRYYGQTEELELKYFGKVMSVTTALLKRIENFRYEQDILYQPVVDGSKVYFPLSMFIIDDEGVVNFEKEDKEKDVFYSIVQNKKSKEIMEEMISKVDKKAFKAMLNIGGSYNRRCVVSDKVVDLYLQRWAKNKYEYYLMFDRNLCIKKDVEYYEARANIYNKVNDLKNKYNAYSIILNLFSEDDFYENICPESELLEDFCKDYKSGMKLSKFLSKYIKNPQFDIDLSKVLQDKKTKSSLFISIDPCDFMTVSINKHNWKSCHNILDGMYGTAPFSLMLDESSLVAFASKGDMLEYELKENRFNWNSKQARLMINIDKQTGAMSFNKPYPNMNEKMQEEIRNMMEEAMSRYLKIENEWKIQSSERQSLQPYIIASGGFHYTDPIFSMVIHSKMNEGNTKPVGFRIGVPKIFCLECGEELSGGNNARNYGILCPECYRKLNDSRF